MGKLLLHAHMLVLVPGLAALGSANTSGSSAVCTKKPCFTDINATKTFRRWPEPNIVPWPRTVSASAAYTTITEAAVIVATGPSAPLAHLLADELADVTLGALNLTVTPTMSSSTTTLSLVIEPNSAGFYAIDVGKSGATLKAATYEGLVAATATLLQMIEFSGDDDGYPNGPFNCSTASVWRLPHLTIRDSPEFAYRGLMVDCARNRVPVVALKQFVVLCRFYKLNYLHLHLTDDQSFTFPSTAFPQLAAKSSFSYTLEELRELQKFAELRGVTCIGEMDVPGHSSAMIAAMPDFFGFPSAPTLGIVNFANQTVIKQLQTLFGEIDDVLPSPFVAIGGDEVSFPSVEHLPEVVDALRRCGLRAASDLYRLFIVEMHSYAVSKGKTLRVWEGFGPQEGQVGHKPVNSSTVAMPTQNLSVSVFDGVYYNPPQLARDGYHIINSNTATIYVNEPTATPQLIYQWHPWLFGDLAYAGYESWWELPMDSRHMVDGVQICMWGAPAAAMLAGMRSRAPAFSDRSWNPHAMRSFVDYEKRQATTDQKLEKLLPPPPQPPPMPSPPKELHGFHVQSGACRDSSGQYSSPRIECPEGTHFLQLVARCAALGPRCDAVDIDADPVKPGEDPVVSWGAVWGLNITAADASHGWIFYCDGDCNVTGVVHQGVCRGNQGGNTCYHRLQC